MRSKLLTSLGKSSRSSRKFATDIPQHGCGTRPIIICAALRLRRDELHRIFMVQIPHQSDLTDSLALARSPRTKPTPAAFPDSANSYPEPCNRRASVTVARVLGTNPRPRNQLGASGLLQPTVWSARGTHNRNSEPPAILLCHERALCPSLPPGSTGMIVFRFREKCALQHVPREEGAPRLDSSEHMSDSLGASVRGLNIAQKFSI
jgi:hypothetical protein